MSDKNLVFWKLEKTKQLKNMSLSLLGLYCLQRSKEDINNVLVLTMTENWRQFYKQVIFDIFHENSHIFKTKLAITMKLSGNVSNRLMVIICKVLRD